MKTILIVEDEVKMRKIIRDYLEVEGFNIIEAEDGREALDIFSDRNIDLIILDIMIPEYDGWSVCRKIRSKSNVPIIMLTARSEESDEIFGLELGADEYITKPFSPKILVARIKNVLKREKKVDKEEDDFLRFGKLKINPKSHRVFYENKQINLAPKEYDLLIYFSEHPNVALSRERLMNRVWGYDYFGDFRTVDTHVKKIRKKLPEDFIETVRSVGYMFNSKE